MSLPFPEPGMRLIKRDQIDEFVDRYPESCGRCGHQFTAGGK